MSQGGASKDVEGVLLLGRGVLLALRVEVLLFSSGDAVRFGAQPLIGLYGLGL